MSAQFQKNLILVLLMAAVAGYVGYDFGRRGYALEIRKNPPQINIVNKTPTSQNLDFSLFWQVFDMLNQKSVYRPLDAKKALYGAIRGLTESLGDPYTTFLDPSQNESVNSSLEGKYEGIGAELGIKNNQLMVVTPLDDSPAKASNVKAGDLILKIDGKDTAGISLTEAVSAIRGKAGTAVVLNLFREGEKTPFDVTITRARITVQSVKWEDKGDGLVYIRISRFGESTNDEWDNAVSDINAKIPNLRGIVLDVRYNPGGYLQSAIHIASEFIRSGTVVMEEFADGTRQPFGIDHQGRLTGTPVAVLINKGSASASEILAGALRDVRRAKLVGEKSFGKGSVQDARSFPDGSGVHITIAKWLTPKGTSINGQGLEADVKIELEEEDLDKDPQLEKALEILRSGEK